VKQGAGNGERGAGTAALRFDRTTLSWSWVPMVIVCSLLPAPRSLAGQDLEQGKRLYERWCTGCHGDTGAGDGEAAAYMLPRPRDFTGAVYQIRTTASGELPTDDDLRAVIDEGMPGTAMPGWADQLNSGQRDDVIAYLKTFSRFFDGAEPEPISMGRQPGRPSEEDLAEARRLFVEELQCSDCHGLQGRGDGTSARELTDDWGFPIRATDLTRNWNFNGGGTVEDIYTRMRTGLDGTPMPSQSDAVDAGVLTDEELWRVAQYVRSLSPDDPPQAQDVVRAALFEGPLPSGPDDSLWADVEPYYIPMVGQITINPRWFVPTVDGIWVQAAHDNQNLAVKLSWSDATQSPDPDWDPFFQGIVRTLAAADKPHLTEQGPDRVGVQFPLEPPEGIQLPFFLGGDVQQPVYMWQWSSAPDQVQEGTAVGLGTFAANPGSPEVTHTATFSDGRWQVQFTRALAASDPSLGVSFTPGEPLPMAFYAADGTDGEDTVRGAVSSWYAIYLDVPTPPRVFVAPIVAVMLTAGLGFGIVRLAQRRERGA
jgi:DMSO reductase family type II enzyme heme b subunit